MGGEDLLVVDVGEGVDGGVGEGELLLPGEGRGELGVGGGSQESQKTHIAIAIPSYRRRRPLLQSLTSSGR